MSGRGFGFVIPTDPNEPDIFIPREGLSTAMHGDQVVVRIVENSTEGRKAEGRISKILQRANLHVAGLFQVKRGWMSVRPAQAKIAAEISVPKRDANGARAGDEVLVEITRWPQTDKKAQGKVIEILGRQGDPGVDVLALMTAHGLPREFLPETIAAAEKIPATIAESDLRARRDLRDLPVVTIDSEDAKDLDDAVYVEAIGPQRYRLGVHIADVSHYVREGGPLDREARQRGTSTYLVDRVIPMLPARLSNGICSLNQGEDRLTLSIAMDMDAQGHILAYDIFPAVIRVRTRLTYTIVRGILAEQDGGLRSDYASLVPMLETMEKLAASLRQKRLRRGAIDFDLPELKVKLSEAGRPMGIEKRVRTVAESIIEEFMLAANETVAEHMNRLNIPFVYRVHADPDPEKMLKLADLLRSVGQHPGAWTNVKPRDLQQALLRLQGQPEEKMISAVMLRSLKQARYETENAGHFGLAAEYYTHFTSPIRRYPDLIVHRLIHETLAGPLALARRDHLTALLPQIAADSSDRERAAAEAERESVDMKTAEYMTQFIGEEFAATISGVTAFGLFVELENGVEGLVHISVLDDDYYVYQEDQLCLIGQRSKKRYRLGDAITVRLVGAQPAERTIDFALAGTPAVQPRIAARRKTPIPHPAKSKRKEVKPSAGKKARHKDRRRKP